MSDPFLPSTWTISEQYSKSHINMNDILEKCEKKFSSWKRNNLSLGGLLVLLNFVIDSLLTYTMNLFPLPASVAKKLDKIRKTL